jgi:hypothetical protein
VRRRGNGPILAPSGGPGHPILAPSNFALDYAMVLDPWIQLAANELVCARIQGDPARCLLEYPDPLMALFAVWAVADGQGVAADEAKKILVEEA